MIQEGLVLSVAGGFCRVSLKDSRLLCKLRGRLRREGLVAGDRVLVTPGSGEDGTVEEVLPRRNRLRRPAVANVDQVLVVFTASEPPLHLSLVDRVIVLAAFTGLEIILCLNKTDLMEPGEVNRLKGIYHSTGFPFFATSALQEEGVGPLRPLLSDRVTVLAGQSGVGKSRLLNSLYPELSLPVGTLSRKTSQGRHTTRQAELLPVAEGGWIADTPGFSRLDLEGISPDDLAALYPEIHEASPRCRFVGCRHVDEPDCAVQEEVGESIAPERYRTYKNILEELVEMERRKYD